MFSCSSTKTTFKSVDADAFEKVLSNNDIVCLDVRTADEYAEQHIANALNIDVQKPDFVQNALNTLPLNKTIAVYCRSGKRSKKACSFLKQNHFDKIIELNTGILGWLEADKPVVR